MAKNLSISLKNLPNSGKARARRTESIAQTDKTGLIITAHLLSSEECAICGVSNCSLVAHRLAALQILRRTRKLVKLAKPANSEPKLSSDISSTIEDVVKTLPRVVTNPKALQNLIDPFTPFPVTGAKRDTMCRFHDFFSQQGGFIADRDRQLVFDKANFPALYPAAMRNPALCLSLVAMATSYNAIHHRNRLTPDAETLAVYNQCFEMIRLQIEKEKQSELTESTVMAVINLNMCSGIGFADVEASMAHWNGLLSLVDKLPRLKLSGRILSFVTQIEYWLTISFGSKPRSEQWPEVLVHQRPPTELYGKAFQELFNLLDIQSETSSKLLSVCLTMCRATEVLETDVAKRPINSETSPEPSTYFAHLYDVLSRQQAQLYCSLLNSNSLFECICLTLNIYFLLVIRCTPWRAPLESLCMRLRNSLMCCEMDVELGDPTTVSTIAVCAGDKSKYSLIQDLRLWMVFICAFASQLCQNPSCEDWTICRIREICKDQLDVVNEAGRQKVSLRMRNFCWSEMFLSKRFEKMCDLSA